MQTSNRVRNNPGGSRDHAAPQLRAEPAANNRLRGPSAAPRRAPLNRRRVTGRSAPASNKAASGKIFGSVAGGCGRVIV